MARPKGLPKTGGRVAGTPNRTTQALAEKLEKLRCDPIEGLAKIALDTGTPVDLKIRCFAELAQYLYPKRKALDVDMGESRDLRVVVEHIGRKGEPVR